MTSGSGIACQEWLTCWCGGNLAGRGKSSPPCSSKSTVLQTEEPREILSMFFLLYHKGGGRTSTSKLSSIFSVLLCLHLIRWIFQGSEVIQETVNSSVVFVEPVIPAQSHFLAHLYNGGVFLGKDQLRGQWFPLLSSVYRKTTAPSRIWELVPCCSPPSIS